MYNWGHKGLVMNALRRLVPGLSILLALSWGLRAQAGATPGPGQSAAIVPLTGQIDDYSRNDLVRRFEKAKALGAKVIIIDINSPGGLVTASMDISQFLKRQSDIHTVAFIEKAYSGAAMVAVACDEIWMQPSAPLGDCAPIVFDTGGKLEPLPDTERAKQESPVVAEFIDSAQRNGYNPLLLTGMVSLRHGVYVLTNDAGEIKVVDDADYKRLSGSGWKLAPGYETVDGPDNLVTLNPHQAITLHVARGVAGSPQVLASERNWTIIADLHAGWGEKLVEFFNNPFVRMILLTIFLQSLYIALHAPGHGAAEAVAIVSIALLIGIPLLTGYAQWWEVLCIFIGLALCAFEIFVFPGHMVSLILGTLMVVFGLVMTFVGKEPTGLPGWLPTLQQTWTGLEHGLSAVVGAIICCALLSVWLRRYLPSIPYFNKLILTATTGNIADRTGAKSTAADLWPFTGTIGVALTDLRPGGSGEFPFADATRGTNVVSSSGFLPRGTRIEVEEVQGNRVLVRAVK